MDEPRYTLMDMAYAIVYTLGTVVILLDMIYWRAS